MAQNNSLFVWKTSNYSCGRSNLRNDTNQVTNLKSLGFAWERIANLLGVFPEVVLCNSVLWLDCVAKVVSFVSVAEAVDSPAPTLRSSTFTCPPSTSYTGEQSS